MKQNMLFIVGEIWDRKNVYIEDTNGRLHEIRAGREEYRPEKYPVTNSSGTLVYSYGFSPSSIGFWRRDENKQLFIDVIDNISGKVLSLSTPLTEQQLKHFASDSGATSFTKAAVRSVIQTAIQNLRDEGYTVISPEVRTQVPLL